MDRQFTPFAEYLKTRAESESASQKGGFEVRRYEKGKTIFTQGAPGYAAYVIKKGSVEISIREDGRKSVLTTMGEQSVFGEVALLTGHHTRSATAMALEDTEVIRIPKKVFDQYLADSPKVISACLVAIAHRLHDFKTATTARPVTLERMARIMSLCQGHGAESLDRHQTLSCLALALDKPEDEIGTHLSTMADFNLIELTEGPEPAILLLGGNRFLEKALKVFSMIEGYEPV